MRSSFWHVLVAVAVVGFGGITQAGVYKEGKLVSGVKSEIDIMVMKWGRLDDDKDRLIGTVRVYDPRVVQRPYDYTFALTFDFFDQSGERLDSMDTSFTFKTYGYQTRGRYVEGEFCIDLSSDSARKRAKLMNVKINSSPAKYQTKFNISASLMRTSFGLPEPKVTPVR